MIAYIADGRLFVREDDGSVRAIESPFIKKKIEDEERERQLNAWKQTQPEDGMDPTAVMLWGAKALPQARTVPRFTDVADGGDGTIFYVVRYGPLTGLFRHDLQTGEERRLFHKTNFHIRSLDFSPARRQFVIALQQQDGSVNLELLDEEGREAQGITEGDSVDIYPYFSRSNSGEIVFASAGIGRNDQGLAIHFGPMQLCKINLESGELTELHTDPAHDYLLPRMDEAGQLYCIRRPHRRPSHKSPKEVALMIVTFIPDLLVAIVGFLNTFIHIFGKKKAQLRRLGPMAPPQPEQNKFVSVLGDMINMADVKRNQEGEYSLAPENWQLVEIKNKNCNVIDRTVCHFDLADGALLTTNGNVIRRVSKGLATKFCKDDVIESVRFLRRTKPA